jgi:Hepatocyte growth factor-regulated tyrosine kinase substrate
MNRYRFFGLISAKKKFHKKLDRKFIKVRIRIRSKIVRIRNTVKGQQKICFPLFQDKLSQVKDARAALDALREEERERRRREAEEAERQRQIQLAQKLEVMRKKKAEYLEYQRQVPVFHRLACFIW